MVIDDKLNFKSVGNFRKRMTKLAPIDTNTNVNTSRGDKS